MKFIQAICLAGVFAPWSIVAKSEVQTQSVRRDAGYYYRRGMQSACTVMKVVKSYESGSTEEYVECQLADEDLLHGEAFRIVKIRGLEQSVVDEAQSGETMLSAPGAIFDGASNALLIPVGGKVELSHISTGNRGRRLATTIGNKEVLVLRESRSVYSEEVISDEIFGTAGDVINLASQYAACSYNQLTFSRWTGNELVNEGVLTVSISAAVSGASDSIIRDAMVSKAMNDLGSNNLANLVDHVMVCIPEGTVDKWIAYAYINSWMSVYNNQWCNFPSAQLHELGHNFNMAHSNDYLTNAEYDDQSGMMGYSYSQDESPRMCFNGPKTYQFGWFSEHHVDLPSGSTNHWAGTLIGFAEKKAAGTTAQDRMIVRIRPDSSCASESCDEDYYVHFNSAVGFNVGTLEGKNQVLVSKRKSSAGYKASWLVAKLDVDGVYTVADFQGIGVDLVITVNAIAIGTPRRASVTVRIGDIPLTDCDDKSGLFDFGEKQKNCDWLRFRSLDQIDSLCQDSAVSTLCKETCGLCTDTCEDDMAVSFQIDNKIGDKDCKWVAAKQQRKDKYCRGNHVAFFTCRESCESCDTMYDVFPSAAPSEMMPDPLADGECKDNDFRPFIFGTKDKTCVWLRRQSSSFQDELCVPGEDVYFACEATCGRCTRDPMPGTCNTNGVCDAGENCESCPDDCRIRHHATKGFCCVGGECGRGCDSFAGDRQWECSASYGR